MKLLKDIYHFLYAWLGNIIYRFPSRKIFVIGITGTKGKSSVVELLTTILESVGKHVAVLSSTRMKVGAQDEKNQTENTMPGRFFIQKFLRDAVDAGCEFAIIEVTSQGVLQHRHRFIDFDAALFLNIHPEHIEAHGSYETYRGAKLKFFSDVFRFSRKEKKLFFINRLDKEADRFSLAVSGGEIVYFNRETFIKDRFLGKANTLGDWFSYDFNLENAALAAAVGEQLGVSREQIVKAFKSFSGFPGRMDIVQEKPFRIVVDYAHTPDSLEAVYKALSGTRGKKLICVLGSCGGGRDAWKRPVFGKIASAYCKSIIITDEDPYDESPEKIMQEIISGLSEEKKKLLEEPRATGGVWKIIDRKAAINHAKSIAKKGDIVVITGKGSENSIHIKNGEKIPWSDREAALS